MDKDKVEAFLREYRDLCMKHGIRIGSCGCCNSPWPTTGDKQIEGFMEVYVDLDTGKLTYVDDNNGYEEIELK